ncbi:MAG: outer membrane beta-barrel protein [Candidatus Korobacteraceae bacterium]
MTYPRSGQALPVVNVIRLLVRVTMIATVVASYNLPIRAQQQAPSQSAGTVAVSAQTLERLQQHLTQLEAEVTELKAQMKEIRSTASPATLAVTGSAAVSAHSMVDGEGDGALSSGAQVSPESAVLSAEDRSILNYLKGTTINVSLDGYYAYNFNDPIGRVNLLRAYDVSSNAFSLNQAAVIFERAPDVDAGRRFGARLDLQFGQATATLQGNPVNEPRPAIYRNVFQAYGTYVVPVGSGLTVDFGKWASSLGIEGNYTQFQINYSRSYWFNFLPFYHMGIRTQYNVNKKLALNYWVINGNNQTEPTNSFKDELFGFVVTPNKNISWTVNYYLGQDHPDAMPVATCGPVPVQPGLCFQPITPAPNGKLHIFDTYASWQTTQKLLLQLEGDYVIERLWANTRPGQSSAPSHTTGGAGYAKYQLTPRTYVGARAEYLSDRGGLFSGVTEALKEVTATYDVTVANGFEMKYEFRRDWSNVPIFLTGTQNVFSKDQNTATAGIIWWFGRKQGPW